MSNRKLQLISKELADLLIKQVAHEVKNFGLYKSYANYFSVEGVPDLEKYYNKRASEEFNHQEWILNFLFEADVKFMFPAIELNPEKIENEMSPFTQTVDREIVTTQMLYTIYEQAISEKDYMTASWLYDKLIKEQIEEENISRMANTIMQDDSSIYLRAAQVYHLIS